MLGRDVSAAVTREVWRGARGGYGAKGLVVWSSRKGDSSGGGQVCRARRYSLATPVVVRSFAVGV